MNREYPSLESSHELLTRVRTRPIYVGMFLGVQIGFAALAGNQVVATELLRAALGPQLRMSMFIVAILVTVFVVIYNNIHRDYTIPTVLLYAAKVPYDLFAFTTGSLIAITAIFLGYGLIVGDYQWPLLLALVLATCVSVAAMWNLVLGLNLASIDLREAVPRSLRDPQFRKKFSLIVGLYACGMLGERLYRLF